MEPEIQEVAEKGKLAAWWEANAGSVGTTVNFLLVRAIYLGVIMGMTIMVYQEFFAPKIVTVDVRGIIGDEIAQADKRGDSDQKRAVLADRFNTALEAELNKLNNGRNIVMVTAAVIRGGDDKTKEIQARVRARMEGKGGE